MKPYTLLGTISKNKKAFLSIWGKLKDFSLAYSMEKS